MQSAEQNPQAETTSEQWQERIRVGIEEQLESFDIFFPATDQKPEAALDLSPFSFTEGKDERMYDELSPQEQAFIKNAMFAEIGFDLDTAEEVAAYDYSAPEGASWQGRATAHVYATPRTDQGIYVHQIHYPEGKEEILIAPASYRL